jgi:Family of unknown function (DUF6326)
MSTATDFEPSPVNIRVKISALWVSLLFIFAYGDIFVFYRSDLRGEIEAGKISGFTINQSFLVGITMYTVIPSLMVFLSLILRPRINRTANIIISIVYALTIMAAAIGEWTYFLLASGIELAILATIIWFAWNWPRQS